MLLKPFILILVFICTLTAAAQIGAEDDTRCNEDFAKLLASQLVEEGRSVSDAGKGIKVLIRSADFIWPVDEAAARTYFTEAYKRAVDNHREHGIDKKETKSGAFTITTSAVDHRFEVLTAIAKHDGPWARKLTDELLTEYEKDIKNKKDDVFKREIHSLLRVALEAVDRDRDLSFYIYRRIMRYPLDNHWFWALYSLSGKDDSLASALYSELLQNYRNEPSRRLLFLSAYPFARDRMFGIDKFQSSTTLPDGQQPRQDLQRLFIDVFLDRVIRFAANNIERQAPPEPNRFPEPVYMYTTLNELEPLMVEFHPSLLQKFAMARAQATSMLTPEMQESVLKRKKQEEFESLTFEERIARLEKAYEEGTLTDWMIVSLVTRLRITEEQFALLLPWLDKIKEKTARDGATSMFWFQRSKLAMDEGRFPEAETFAAKVPELEYQATLTFYLAEAKLKSVLDAASVYQLLSESAKLARRMEDSPSKAKVLLGLAYQYEKINHGFALEELGEAVRVINRLKDPDLFSSGVQRQIVGKSFAFYTFYSVPGYDPENTFRTIAENDFDLALSNARSIEDRVIRSVAVIAVAKRCLEQRAERQQRRPADR